MKLRFIFFTFLVNIATISFAQSSKIICCKTYNLKAIFIGGKKNTLVNDKANINLNTKAKTGKCHTSCNFINFKFSVKKNIFTLTNIKPDTLPCPDYLDGLEADLKENLPKINLYKLNKGNLIFFSNADTLLIFK